MGKTWKQPISHPKCLWSSAFEPGIVPVINCFKSLHFLCLRSLRNASLCGINLSGLQSWAYTESWFTHSRWEIGLWWSTGASHTPYSIHGLAPLWWRSLGSWWWTLWSSQQINKSTIKLKLGFWGGTAEAMKNICSIWVRHSLSRVNLHIKKYRNKGLTERRRSLALSHECVCNCLCSAASTLCSLKA